MRRGLDLLFGLCAALAAVALAGIAVIILAGTLGRLVGIVVPSANELSGYLMAAATFLALAPTLRAGGHIRVSLVIGSLPDGARRAAEILCLSIGAALVAYFAWWAVDLAVTSWDFGDVSPGLLPVPLWIPQAFMAFGLIAFAVALVESLVLVIAGRAPPYGYHAEGLAGPQE
jgi:TRAP-type C4-dicarboxylate transport system permease small subunit